MLLTRYMENFDQIGGLFSLIRPKAAIAKIAKASVASRVCLSSLLRSQAFVVS
jgi:hypothetical protein